MKTIKINDPALTKSTSGVRGVSFHKKTGKWEAAIRINFKDYYLGLFTTIEEANNALIAFRGQLPTAEVTLVSDEDYEYLSKYAWHRNAYGYVDTHIRLEPDKPWRQSKMLQLLMHRAVAERMGLDIAGKLVDHVNMNPRDNRRENLRVADKSQNGCNRGIPANNKSGVKGVYWIKARKRWGAAIAVNGEKVWCKLFDNLEDARIAREKMLPLYHGEFARCC